MLAIEDLSASIGGKHVLKNFNLRINKGETHALLGPNVTGKTTLLNVIAGIPRYTVDAGRITFKETDITHMSMDGRARLGIGMAFQRPPALHGLSSDEATSVIVRGFLDVEIEGLPEDLKQEIKNITQRKDLKGAP